MKKTSFIFIILIIALGGVYLSYKHFNKPITTNEIKDSPFSTLTPNEKQTFTEGSEWYDTKIEYPANNQKVRDLVFQKYTDYTKETRIKNYDNLDAAKEGLAINVEGLKYAFSAEYELATSSNTITYVYQIYTFTGGAHGSTVVFPITLDDKLNVIGVEQILPDTSLSKIAQYSEAEIKKQKIERMKSYGNMTQKEIDQAIKEDDFISEGVKPTRDNYSNAWYDGDNVVISFGQYQVGSYAEGMFEVKIPKTEIQ